MPNGKFNAILPASISRAALAAGWAGSLGGLAISFKGVFDHKGTADPEDPVKTDLWDNELLPWHLGRPFSGIIVGIFVFLALKAVYPSGNPSAITLAAASFVLGTQEKGFFEFIKQIGTVIVSIPKKDPPKNDKLTDGSGAAPKQPADE